MSQCLARSKGSHKKETRKEGTATGRKEQAEVATLASDAGNQAGSPPARGHRDTTSRRSVETLRAESQSCRKVNGASVLAPRCTPQPAESAGAHQDLRKHTRLNEDMLHC